MGVCCIVFDIYGILFEFFINFLNIEKNIFFFFQYFKFSSRFMLFPTFKKKFGVQKKFRGGGVWIFFLEKQFFLISLFMLFSTLKKYIEKCPFTYWLNGRWFLQIVERDSWHLCPLYPLFPCSDFGISNVGVVGGGGV